MRPRPSRTNAAVDEAGASLFLGRRVVVTLAGGEQRRGLLAHVSTRNAFLAAATLGGGTSVELVALERIVALEKSATSD